MEELDTKLTVKLDGNDVIIDVIDIVESPEYKKEYIFYTISGVPNQEIFASVLNESEESYSLDTIEDDEEFDYVNQLIAKMSLEFEEETVKEPVLETEPEKLEEEPNVIAEAKEEVDESVYDITAEEPVLESNDQEKTNESTPASNFDFSFDIENTTNPMPESENNTVEE